MTDHKKRNTIWPGAGPYNDRSPKSNFEQKSPPVPALPIAHGRPNAPVYKRQILTPTTHENKTTPPKDSSALSLQYKELMTLDQSGDATICYDRDYDIVAIKKIQIVDKSVVPKIHSFTSDHVVNIIQTFLEKDEITIIYEKMDISLRRMLAVLSPVKEHHIAIFCKELVLGLLFIHEKLGLFLKHLNCGTVLLNLEGKVKIANIGESFLQRKSVSETGKREDICCIGYLMTELMDPETYSRNNRTIELQNRGSWSSGILDFHSCTQAKSLKELKLHEFLPKESQTNCFKPHVFSAIRVVGWV